MIIESIITSRASDAPSTSRRWRIWRDQTPARAVPAFDDARQSMAHPFAVINPHRRCRVFAGCLTGRAIGRRAGGQNRQSCHRRAVAPGSHDRTMQEDETDAVLCRVVHAANHRAFGGFSRAQAAVIRLRSW
jgi:hypothetical protein